MECTSFKKLPFWFKVLFIIRNRLFYPLTFIFQNEFMRKNAPTYLHLFLWLLYALLLFLLLIRSFSMADTLAKGSVMLLMHVALFYLNSEVLIPQLIRNRKIIYYVLAVLFILLAMYVFFRWFNRFFTPEDIQEMIRQRGLGMRNPRVPKIPNPGNLLRTRIILEIFALFLVLIVSTAYALSRYSRSREKEESERKSEQMKSEMTFLKSQINPHFLFNALNNIYSLSLTGSKEAPDMILKLSHMLRYMIYECNETRVSLDKEWEYIQHFIDFQRLKSSEELNIQMDYINQKENTLIVPMLLIPFIENAFKHSNVENAKNGWVRINLNNQPDSLTFMVENSIPEKRIEKDKVGGIGLKNVKRRLELAYPNRYQLILNETQSFYSVNLHIQK
jgi:two-component system LytT family sensor kinase